MAAKKKAAKKKAAAKKKPAKAASRNVRRVTKYAKDNPYRAGTEAASKYDAMLSFLKSNTKATVADVVAGSKMDSNLIRDAVKRGFVELAAA